MNWKHYISQLNAFGKMARVDFRPPVSWPLFQDARERLSLQELPSELEELYKETNGIADILDGEMIGELIWAIDSVIDTNLQYRNDVEFKKIYKPFDQLLFFSDAGNGDLFGFVIKEGKFDRQDIFVWNHEDDSRTWVAPSLEKFIECWTNGTIQV